MSEIDTKKYINNNNEFNIDLFYDDIKKNYIINWDKPNYIDFCIKNKIVWWLDNKYNLHDINISNYII